MKKYLSLFLFLVMIVTLGSIKIVKAEDSGVNSDTTTDTDIKTEVDTKSALTPLQKRMKAEADMRAQLKIQGDLKTKDDATENELKDEVKDKIEKIKEDIQTLREEAKNKMDLLREGLKNEKDKAKAKIAELRITSREKAAERFNTSLDRMNSLKDKVNSQITKWKAKGVDTTNAESFIVTIQAKLDAIQVQITQANTIFSKSAKELTADDKASLKVIADTIQGLLKETQKNLDGAVKALREAVKAKLELKVDATSSTTVNPN